MMLFGSNPKELTKAFAIYGAAAPAGGTAGVFLGGVITEWISWPWVFYINIPIALARARRHARPDAGRAARAAARSTSPARSPPPPASALTVFGIVRAPEDGWGSAATLARARRRPRAARRRSSPSRRARREPLMRLSIFRTPNLAAANLAQLLLGAAWIPMWFFLNLYLQQVLGYGAFEGGAALLPMTVAIMVADGRRRPAGRSPASALKTPIVAGLLLLAAGMAVLSLVRARRQLRRSTSCPPR